jgi:hypothetical protein
MMFYVRDRKSRIRYVLRDISRALDHAHHLGHGATVWRVIDGVKMSTIQKWSWDMVRSSGRAGDPDQEIPEMQGPAWRSKREEQ